MQLSFPRFPQPFNVGNFCCPLSAMRFQRIFADVRVGSCVTSIARSRAMRNCTRDEGGPFGFGTQVLISSHRKLLWSKAVVVSVAETPGQDSGRQGRERRAQANRCRSVESGLGDVETGG